MRMISERFPKESVCQLLQLTVLPDFLQCWQKVGLNSSVLESLELLVAALTRQHQRAVFLYINDPDLNILILKSIIFYCGNCSSSIFRQV